MKFEKLDDKVKAWQLKDGDHIMVGDMLWKVVRTYTSMSSPPRMIQLAYHTHTEPKSYKFHQVNDDDRFDVFRLID